MSTTRLPERQSGRGRRGERGAAVFIVVMVVTLVTAIGVFAARSTSLVDVATGYERQLVQTRLLSDYAGRLATAELATGDTRTYVNNYERAGSNGGAVCRSNDRARPLNPGGTLKCDVISMQKLNALVGQQTGGTQTFLAAQTATSAGSLGPQLTGGLGAGTEGVVRVEIIDAYEAEPAPGSPARGGFTDVQFTLTAYAQVRSAAGNMDWCGSAAASQSASVQMLRAQITVPNVPKNASD
jgi:hypothetical protein